ncbi:hypothetical protein V502_11097 [Pseudogymnoascus sp. VKM F-4520 (FW-2644)]|nr:hypothetical protein V502_11097 [Pseudogymnoascus sp. VKM F-4520 (FW-2644)]
MVTTAELTNPKIWEKVAMMTNDTIKPQWCIHQSYVTLMGYQRRDAEENVQLTDGTDYDRLVLEQLPSRGSLPVVSLSPGPITSLDYSKNWLPPLRTVSETFISTVLREEPSQQQLLANDKRNQLLKFYVDEVAPWVSFSRQVAPF